MYAHIPSAWLSLMLYFISSIGIILYFSYKNLFFAFFSYSISVCGFCFSLICLLSGMIWGKLTWGVWWAWDPRLTSMLILCIFYFIFIYLFFITKKEGVYDFKIPGIINLIGAINLPIIKFSVEFYNSLHQKSSIIRKGGMSIYGGLSKPLWFFFAGFIVLSIFFSILILKSELFLLKKNRKEKLNQKLKT
jgi:heme exporter protein C